jgi:hypothetical protein
MNLFIIVGVNGVTAPVAAQPMGRAATPSEKPQ